MGAQVSDMAGAVCGGLDGKPGPEKEQYVQRRGIQPEEVTAEQLVDMFGSPMHAAALLGNTTDIESLASSGHMYEVRDKNGRTPCHLAAVSGKVENLQALVKLGADLGVEDHNGNSPLVYAVYHSRRQTVKWIKWRNWSERQQASNNLNDSVYSPSASFGSEPGGGLPAHDGTGWVDGDNATLDANTSIVSVLSHNSADSSASYASTTRPYSWKGLPSQMQDGIHTGMHALMTNNCPLSPRTQNHFTAIPSNSRRGDGHETRPITPPSPPTMPEFAWRECKKMRQLAGLVNLVAPDVFLSEHQLRTLMRDSDDDVVQFVALFQDRYAEDTIG